LVGISNWRFDVKVSLMLKDDSGNVFEGEADLKLKRQGVKSAIAEAAPPRSSPAAEATKGHPRTPTDALQRLHQKSVFKIEKDLKAVEQELAKIDCNFPKASLAKALGRADFLTRHGKRGSYGWIQKYPPGV
jgi:hypothetical protein